MAGKIPPTFKPLIRKTKKLTMTTIIPMTTTITVTKEQFSYRLI